MMFYGFWSIKFISLMVISAVNDFYLSLLISKTNDKKKKKIFLYTSLFINLSLLFVFKYLFFFTSNLESILSLFSIEIDLPEYNILLPLGISFYTFQTISYTIDVFRGFIKPEKKISVYLCYVMFFPQLVAGPIVRASEIVNQLRFKTKFEYSFLVSGIERILVGLFLKTVLADNIAPLVDDGFSMNPKLLSAIDVWTLSFLFGFQIYFDFSAYSHIAIGSANLFGVLLPENFNFPYAATSLKDFWKRWHISLSSWIRDYLYLPLMGLKVRNKSTGGIEVKNSEKKMNLTPLFLTWAIMGLWHGANWTFVFWGVYHAFFITIERIFMDHRLTKRIFTYGLFGYIFTILVIMASWIPFRSENLSQAFLMLSKLYLPYEYLKMGLRANSYIVAAMLVLTFLLAFYYEKYLCFFFKKKIPILYATLQFLILFVLISAVIIFLRPVVQFIYFQF